IHGPVMIQRGERMDVQIGKKVLLTGAGFTHNFGAPLADGMWTEIFNQPQVQAAPRVRSELAGDFDFEGVYNAILTGNFTDEEKQVITEAVFAAYEKLDGKVTDYFKEHGVYNLHTYEALIAKFGSQPGRRFFFTLNQDLFIKRGSRTRSEESQVIRPGIEEKVDWLGVNALTRRLEDDDRVRLPSPGEFLLLNPVLLPDEGFFYVKLHGSQDWLSYGGERQMVLGRGKEGKIGQEPLLKRYLELLHEVLTAGERDLLVIGYGFGDEHINRIIAEAVRDHALKLYILSPRSP